MMRSYQSLLHNKLQVSSQLRQTTNTIKRTVILASTTTTPTTSTKIKSSHFSTETAAQPHYLEEPWKYLTGATKADLESNPVLAQYMEANFSHIDLRKRGGDVIQKSDAEIEVAEKKLAKVKKQQELHPLSDLGIRSLHCYPRDLITEEGSLNCRRFRRNKLVPGVILGRNSAYKCDNTRVGVITPWNLLQRELDLYKYWIPSHVYELTLLSSNEEGSDILSKELVVPTDMQVHPIKNALDSINYLRYYPGRIISIPVKYVNQDESPMLRQDSSLLLPLKRSVPCIIEEGAVFPTWLEVDCSGIKKMGGVSVERVILPDGVVFSEKVKSNMILGTVWGGKAKMEDDEEEAGEVKEEK